MAKKKYSPNSITSLKDDWGLDSNDTEKRPFSGQSVQDFIKSQFNTKVGYVAYDKQSNRYMLFATEDTYNEYKADETKTELLIGSFEAPYNYDAKITLSTSTSNSVFLGTTGNYIDFSFDITNKSGQSTGENVTCTYTFVNGAKQTTVNAIYKANEFVHMNIDDYLEEGTNRIKIGITGADTLASTAVSVTYLVVDLTLEDEFDISKVVDLRNGAQTLEIPYTIKGYGTKELEWYIDGELQTNVKDEDEVVETTTSRTKYITVSGLNQGTHTLQFRAYVVTEGNKFYSKTYYREFMVYTGSSKDDMVALSCEIPNTEDIVTADNPLQLYGLTQYAQYDLLFATYSPKQAASTTVTVKIGDTEVGSIESKNGILNTYTIQPSEYGNKTVSLILDTTQRDIPAYISKTTMSISEITAGLCFAFDATGKTNSSSNKDTWTYNDYTATFTGFDWNNTSGWVDNTLRIAAGNMLSIDYAPLSTDGMSTGKTLEFSFKSLNVKDDTAVICDLTTGGVGIKITASEVKALSSGGKSVSTKYKSEEDVRVSIVLNRHTGSANKGLVFLYVDGIISAAINVMDTENFISKATLSFKGTEDAEIALKQMRFYDSALTSDQILNNYILYQQDVESMTSVYSRNDVYDEDSSFSPDKMVNRLPVMIITGDIPTLENTSNKNEQITVDVEYTNMQDPTKNFKIVGAAMRPQGTSSMSYPKKNFRLYTKRLSSTVLYDASGNEVEDKLYAFKDKAQPVSTWCLKADYAESSGTHNTGIARLWNDVMYNARIDGEYKLRTNAQKAALKSKYNYDVRTTVDGFPILLFYRLTEADDLIFIGKYNFNNDKSTEKVFGFCDIHGFDNSKMQCWEVLNNGDSIALFQTVEDFDNKWSDAFEARYPDGSEDTTDLKAFCEWIVGVKDDAATFATEKWNHLDVYKVAAYYVYLMRFGAVDQTVKNAMFTTEDGNLWYYINYDNDTVNGVINTGELAAEYDITRQSKGTDGQYVYAGHESVLWNLLEADEEFMNIVKTVDAALYVAGLKYSTVIDMFNNQQAAKWCERVYNQDAQYKYIGPYTSSGINNLFMLQGSRSSHRKYWLSKRFDLYDSLFVSGEFKNKVLEFKLTNDTPAGQQFSITAGIAMNYGYGINDIPTETGIALKKNEAYEFTTPRVLNLGDPVRIYAANNIKKLDISKLIDRVNQLTFSTGNEELECLEELTLGSSEKSNSWLSEISGLKLATKLKKLDITNCSGFTGIDLSGLEKMESLNAYGTSLSSVIFEKGSNISSVKLPATMQTITLEQLSKLGTSGFGISSWANVHSLKIIDCPGLSKDMTFITNWYANKTTENANCSLEINGIEWKDINPQTLIKLGQIKVDGGTLNLRGKITLTEADEDTVNTLKEIFGDNAFDRTSELWINAPASLIISGPSSVLEGESIQVLPVVFCEEEGTLELTITGEKDGYQTYDRDTNILSTTEKASSRSITFSAKFYNADLSTVLRAEKTVQITRCIYPSGISIDGPVQLYAENTYTATLKGSSYNKQGTVTWSLSEELITIGCVIKSSDNTSCIVQTNDLITEVDGQVIATLTTYSSTYTASIDVHNINENLAVSSKTNPVFMKMIYDAGVSINETYLTKAEAAAVTDSDFQGILQAPKSSTVLTKLDELQYFTGLTSINFSYKSTYLRVNITGVVTLPEGLKEFQGGSFDVLNKDFNQLQVCFTDIVASSTCGHVSVPITNSFTTPDVNAYFYLDLYKNINTVKTTGQSKVYIYSANNSFNYYYAGYHRDYSNGYKVGLLDLSTDQDLGETIVGANSPWYWRYCNFAGGYNAKFPRRGVLYLKINSSNMQYDDNGIGYFVKDATLYAITVPDDKIGSIVKFPEEVKGVSLINNFDNRFKGYYKSDIERVCFYSGVELFASKWYPDPLTTYIQDNTLYTEESFGSTGIYEDDGETLADITLDNSKGNLYYPVLYSDYFYQSFVRCLYFAKCNSITLKGDGKYSTYSSFIMSLPINAETIIVEDTSMYLYTPYNNMKHFIYKSGQLHGSSSISSNSFNKLQDIKCYNTSLTNFPFNTSTSLTIGSEVDESITKEAHFLEGTTIEEDSNTYKNLVTNSGFTIVYDL